LKRIFQNLGSKLKLFVIVFAWTAVSISLFFVGYKIIENSKMNSTEQNISKVIEASTSKETELSFKDRFFNFFKLSSTEPDVSEKKPETNSNLKIIEAAKDLDASTFKSSTWFSDYEAMKKNVIYYNEVHPFIYSMKGGLSNTGELYSSWSKKSRTERVIELRALNPNVKIIPTIFRWENPKEAIQENIGMNGRSDIRDKHIQNILDEVMTYNYDGIDIDYEGMKCHKKEKFEEFIVLLSKELKAKGKLLSVAVHPKTELSKAKEAKCKGSTKTIHQDFAENWRGPMTHDYEFLAKHTDKVKIMAYELHPRKYRNPGPGPQAPNVWLKAIIEYAKKRIPANKLYMAIPTYGYDWALNCNAKAVYFDTATKIKAMNPKQYQPTDMKKIYDENPKSKSWKNLTKFMYIHENKVYEDPSLWYTLNGCDRVAFYMNKKAFEEKMNLLRSYDIAGFSFWQLLSVNDPGINDYLSLLVTNKLPPVPKFKEEPKEVILPEAKTDGNVQNKILEKKPKVEVTP
jgi:spore germination protein YaaH